MQARDINKALDGFTRSAQLDPDNGEAWNNIACLYVLVYISIMAYLLHLNCIDECIILFFCLPHIKLNVCDNSIKILFHLKVLQQHPIIISTYKYSLCQLMLESMLKSYNECCIGKKYANIEKLLQKEDGMSSCLECNQELHSVEINGKGTIFFFKVPKKILITVQQLQFCQGLGRVYPGNTLIP